MGAHRHFLPVAGVCIHFNSNNKSNDEMLSVQKSLFVDYLFFGYLFRSPGDQTYIQFGKIGICYYCYYYVSGTESKPNKSIFGYLKFNRILNKLG